MLYKAQTGGFPGGANGKQHTCQCRRYKRCGSLCQEDPLEEGMATTPIFLPGESHGKRSLAGYSPRGPKESDITKATSHNYYMWLALKSKVISLKNMDKIDIGKRHQRIICLTLISIQIATTWLNQIQLSVTQGKKNKTPLDYPNWSRVKLNLPLQKYCQRTESVRNITEIYFCRDIFLKTLRWTSVHWNNLT